MRIRHADPERDGAACAAIYAPSVTDGIASFEDTAPDAAAMAARIARTAERYPWLVAVDGETVMGYAYASAHRERRAYRWSAESTVYIAADHHRRGVGRALYGALLPLMRAQGLYLALAGIALPNDASVGLHEAVGFTPVGVYENVGFKRGRWLSVGWWQLALRDAVAGETPGEPGGPGRLA